MYRGRAYCSRSVFKRPSWVAPCANTACDRFADAKVIEQAEKANLDIGWADLKTSKCGFVPREGK